MPKFEDNVLGLIPEEDWLNVGFNVTRQNDPIDGLFSDEKTDNIVAKWQSIASEYQVPMMAHFHGFDAEANTTFRVPVDTHNVEKGLIKVKINQSERMRQLVLHGVREDALYDYVLSDGVRLAEQVFTRSKVAKNELLATGKVTINENNLALTVDYGVPTEHTQYALKLTDAKTDIPAQIQTIIDSALDKGVVIDRIVTTRQNVNKLRTNKSLQTIIYGSNNTGALIKRSDLDAYLSEEFGINQIITNDLTYGADASEGEDGRPIIQQKYYYPRNKITFIGTPNGQAMLGVGLWGDPPEVTGLASERPSVASGYPYVYISQWQEKDPAVLWTKASALFMPVLFNPDSLYIATVS